LANEQVIDGRGWRSGAIVERRKLSQWFFRITDFADDLLEALDRLERWPEKVRIMQKNWIGRSEGLHLSFKLEGAPLPSVDVFSTRPDTLFGASSSRCRPIIRWRSNWQPRTQSSRPLSRSAARAARRQ
jgi:leucyl-tRNA synthetase